MEPGCGLSHVGTTSAESRAQEEAEVFTEAGGRMPAGPSNVSTADAVPTARAAGTQPKHRTLGPLAQKGHGRTHRGLELGREDT